MGKSRLETVLGDGLCSGCGLCAAILGPERARMELSEPGYLRPRLMGAPSPAEDAVIAQVCPGSRVDLPPGGDGLAEPEWGPLLRVATGHAVDADLRQRASSGGALSAVLSHLLESGQANYVLQVAASEEVPWLNQLVRSADGAAVRHASGSRYAPSAPLEPLLRCLDEGRPFVVVGKPCDIAALRAYSRHDPRVDQLVTAMIAFMCGGVPSAKGVELLVRKMGADPADVRAFRFRGEGWPGRARALLADGSERTISYNESWGGVLSRHVQLRCKICADGIGMSADLVFADAWYGDDTGYPLFEEADGRSLMLARTPRGLAIAAAAESAHMLRTEALDGAEISRMQPYQLRRIRLTWSRLLAMRFAGRGTVRYAGLPLSLFALSAGLTASLRDFAGTLLRIARGQL